MEEQEIKTQVLYSPEGNPEVWREDEKPEGYMTEEEWFKAHPVENARKGGEDLTIPRQLRKKQIDNLSISLIRKAILGEKGANEQLAVLEAEYVEIERALGDKEETK